MPHQEFHEMKFHALELYSQKNITSWPWIEAAARNFSQNGNYARAESLYLGHLAAVPKDMKSEPCLQALLRVRLYLKNLSTTEETFAQLFSLAEEKPESLLEAAQVLLSFKERLRPGDRMELLQMAEKASRQGLKTAHSKEVSADCSYELARVLTLQQHPAEAIAYYRQGVAGAPTDLIQEERSLNLADALFQLQQYDEAERIYRSLTAAQRNPIQEKAKAGLILIKVSRPVPPPPERP